MALKANAVRHRAIVSPTAHQSTIQIPRNVGRTTIRTMNDPRG